MKIAILTEKQSSLRNCVGPILAHYGPEAELSGLCAHPYAHLWQRFSYPRGLRLADYPLTKETAYRPLDLDSERIHWLKPELGADGEGVKLTPVDKYLPGRRLVEARREDAFANADVIVAAPDADASGFLIATHVLDRLLPLGRHDPRIKIILLKAQDPENVTAALRTPTTFADAEIEGELRAGRIKQRFDYNYAMNANVILRRIQEDSGLPAGTPALSKYALQLLYALRKAEAPETEAAAVKRMSDWRGTGRYPSDDPRYRRRMGSAASRGTIFNSLIAAGLVEKVGERPYSHAWDRYPAAGAAGPFEPMVSAGTSNLHAIGADGRRLLDALHPDCEDADMPFRIAAWQALPEDEAKAKADRYIRTFFGKMARHAKSPPPSRPTTADGNHREA